jgi:hypothetical protein
MPSAEVNWKSEVMAAGSSMRTEKRVKCPAWLTNSVSVGSDVRPTMNVRSRQ